MTATATETVTVVTHTPTAVTRNDGWYEDSGKKDENGDPIMEWVDNFVFDYWAWSESEPTSTTNPLIKEIEISTTVYTAPGNCEWFHFSAGSIIAHADWNSNISGWVKHCEKFNSWYDQSNQYGTLSDLAPSSEFITAAWYNGLWSAIKDDNKKPIEVNGGPNGDIISAALFEALASAINKSIEVG